MPFIVRLHSDTVLTSNIKRRAGGITSAPITTINAVNNNALTNPNIFADNTVEISTDLATCNTANYIVLDFGNSIIAGEITGTAYVNDNNSSVAYVVDHFTTAQMTNAVRGGFMGNIQGLCTRTNLTYPGRSFANQLPEPFTGSDLKRHDNNITQLFNDTINGYLGTQQLSNSFLTNGHSFIVWISSFAARAINENGGNIVPWESPTSPNTNSVTTVDSFEPSLPPVTLWYGGYTNGVPVLFNAAAPLSFFINDILSNVGLRIIIPPDGLTNDGTIRRYVDTANSYFHGDIMTQEEADDLINIEMEQVKMITDDDIFQIMVIPYQFASNPLPFRNWAGFVIDSGLDLSNFNPMQDEQNFTLPDGTVVQGFSKSKAMTFPYYYYKLRTRIGNELNILPQIHFNANGYIHQGFVVRIYLCFVGGNIPKTMICIANQGDVLAPFNPSTEGDWMSIIEYPSISWASGVSSQQQLAELSARMNRTSTIQSAVIGSSTKGTGFTHGLRGGTPNRANQGALRSAMTSVGNFFGTNNFNIRPIATNSQNMGSSVNVNAQNLMTPSLQNNINQGTVEDNAGNVISSTPHQIIGEGGTELLLSQPVAVARCGYTDGELFGLCRFFDRQGQSTHAVLNPITNAGNIFGGNASVQAVGGRTYYEFADLNVDGTMPVDFKNAIQNLFIGGCYLVD